VDFNRALYHKWAGETQKVKTKTNTKTTTAKNNNRTPYHKEGGAMSRFKAN